MEKINVSIVPLAISHLDDIMEIEKLSFTIPWTREALAEEITRNKFAVYIGALLGGKVVGYAGMWKILDEAHITNIAVHPLYRGMKAGSALLEKLIEIARNAGIGRMTLEVRQSNAAAQALYAKYGFKEYGTRKRYYSDNNEDAVIMWKEDII